MQMWRSMLLGGTTLGGVVGLPGRALAGWGDENWGTMVWGDALAVPAVGWLGLGVLGLGLAATAAWTLRKRRPGLGLPLLLVLLAVPLVVVAGTVSVPNTFVNGEVADADQVNANFDAVETAVNDNDSRLLAVETDTVTALSTAAGAATDAAAAQTTADANAAAVQSANGDISANASNISINTAAVQSANGDISANTSNISANTAAIAALGGAATGLEACADGLTVADHDTGLLWEKKTGTPVAFPGVVCETAGCPDPHDVANAYEWSNVSPDPNGNAFTDFLAKLNDSSQPATWSSSSSGSVGTQATGCFADHCDWRLPNVVEIQTILDCSLGAPCIDPLFGPTASSFYWSASSFATNPDRAWTASFNDGFVSVGSSKTVDRFVRAVRAGSCTH